MLQTIVLAFAVVLCLATGVLATEQEHVHNWVLQDGGSRGHVLKCDGCGETKLENHIVDSAEICTVCGVYYHTHNWQYMWSDDSCHNMVCSGCQQEKTLLHTNDSEGVCTACGYTPHEHSWQYVQGENYAYNHGLHCTKCESTSIEDHIYGNDGKCTVCGNAPPHEHQWKWDGNPTNSVRHHFMVCSCGATTAEKHYLLEWDGKMGDRHGHRMVCNTCGYDAFIFEHIFNAEYFHGARCTVCGYQKQGTTVPEADPDETVPVETKPVVTEPEETIPVETKPVVTEPEETIPVETQPEETRTKETEYTEGASTQPAPETIRQNAEEKDSRHSRSIWIWAAVILAAAGGLGAAVIFWKKKS